MLYMFQMYNIVIHNFYFLIFLNFILFIYFLYSRFFLVIYSLYNSLYLLIPNSQSIPSPPPIPLGNHKSALYIWILTFIDWWGEGYCLFLLPNVVLSLFVKVGSNLNVNIRNWLYNLCYTHTVHLQSKAAMKNYA